MSMGDRIKERREQLGMTRDELADKIGVARSAIGNYETNYSVPKIDILYKLFDALKCDANYLYQDEMKEIEQTSRPTPAEYEIIKKIRRLDNHGERVIKMLLEEEYARCTEEVESSKVVELTLDRGSGQLVARNGRDLSQDDKEEILNITRRWREKHPQQN